MQAPTLSLNAAHSPLMYDLSYSLEAILYGHTVDGVVQDYYTSFSERLHQDIHIYDLRFKPSFLFSFATAISAWSRSQQDVAFVGLENCLFMHGRIHVHRKL